MSIQRHIILNHVDSPLKILFWTKEEILLFIVPCGIGLVFDHFIEGLIVTLLCSWGVSKYKKRFGKGTLQAVMYWYLPKPKKLKALPPSHIREYLG